MTMRRDFLAFTAGAAVAKTVLPALAAQAAPAHPDAELLQLCAAFEDVAATCRRIEETSTYEGRRLYDKAGWDYVDEKVWCVHADLTKRISHIPAKSSAGLLAKASAVRNNMALDQPEESDITDYASWSLVNDLLALGRA